MEDKKFEPLGNYIEQIRGVSYKPSDVYDVKNEESIAILRANNIQNNHANFDDLVFIDKNKISQDQYLKKGDVLVCASSGSKNLVGKACLIKEDLDMAFGAFCKVIRTKKLEPRFLGHYFNSDVYRTTISNQAIGANINNIRKEHIDNLLIPIYTKDKQLEIVEKLDKISDMIKNQEEQIKKYDDLVKSQFIEMFGDPVNNEKAWDTKPMIEVIDFNIYKGKINQKDGKVWLLNLDMIESNTGNILDYNFVEEEDVNLSTIKFSGECVLYSKLRPYLNKVVIPQMSGYATSELICLTSEKVNKYFLADLLRQQSFVKFADNSSYGAKMPRASVDDIKNFALILPPIELQNKFADFVKHIDKLKFTLKQTLEKLENCYRSLMQEYFE